MSRVVGGGPAPGAGADVSAGAGAGAGVEQVGRSGLRPGAGRALVAGFTPMIVAWLLQAADGAVGPAAGYMGVCFAVTAAAMVLARGRGDNPATPGARA